VEAQPRGAVPPKRNQDGDSRDPPLPPGADQAVLRAPGAPGQDRASADGRMVIG